IVIKNIAIIVVTVSIIVYLIYRIIDYILRRREMTLEVIVNAFFNYSSYIQIDANLNYLRKYVLGEKTFSEINSALLEEQDNFKSLIDKYIKRKGFEYHIFCEYKEIDSNMRNSKLLIIKMSLLGKVDSYKIIDKKGIELKYLNTI
ncbi:MAG: hypothetical protein U9N10_00760, partial [Bacillota bacterium]|nr:hypothetical protein [Bacillota bacterium]